MTLYVNPVAQNEPVQESKRIAIPGTERLLKTLEGARLARMHEQITVEQLVISFFVGKRVDMKSRVESATERPVT